MTCDRCEESRAAGHSFCMHCGAPLACPRCMESREQGCVFCPSCGRRLVETHPKRSPTTREILRNIVLCVVPVLVFLLVAEAVALVVGFADVFEWAGKNTVEVLVLIPRLEVAAYLSGLGLQLYWVAVFAAILASVAVILWQSLPAAKGASTEEARERFSRTPLFWLTMLLCASLLLNVVVGLLGMDPSSADGVPVGFVPEALYSFANAAVWEEIITRVAYIGLPMAVLALLSRRRDFLRYLVGGFGMSRAALVLLVLSAVVFGFGHLSGWGLWKVLPTTITGLALGYLYIRFGIHVSITFHFIVDYMGVLVSGPIVLVVAVVLLIFLIAGIPCLIEILRRLGCAPDALRKMPNVLPPDQESIFSKRG